MEPIQTSQLEPDSQTPKLKKKIIIYCDSCNVMTKLIIKFAK